MTSMTEHPMGPESNAASRSLSAGIQDLNKQCLRILRCTAEALANSPGGLRFKAGTRPWLEGLSNARPMLAAGLGRRDKAVSLAAGD
ncbi:MAG: hypothetical protein ABI893_05920 [Polaromonas sp.]|uniref:hypothetical protein n=1 Tax=Polaromonas sp. TaxID=1869339 RepID=UPI003266741B